MESIGAYLKRERELRQVSIEELCQTTRIPIKMLRSIEADRFDELPGEVFARGFMRAYARSLGIAADGVIARYDEGRQPVAPPPLPMSTLTPTENGRRFGIAIALVILLILFTLALSIVLRPRHRDSAIELSSNEATPCLYTAPHAPMLSSSVSSTIVTPTASSRC